MAKEVFFFVTSMGGGGSERVISLLANRFIQDGYNVFIMTILELGISYELSDKVQYINIPKLKIRSFRYRVEKALYCRLYKNIRKNIIAPICKIFRIELPNIENTSLYYFFHYSLRSRELLKNYPGAVAFAFLAPAAITLAMASRGLRIKKVYCERNYPLRFDWNKQKIKQRDKYAGKYKFSVFQTEAQKEYYDSIISGEKVIIRNPVKDDLPAPFNGKRSRRIVCFCRLHAQKNLPLLISAFSVVHKSHPDYCLEIYGEGPDRNSVISEIDSHKLVESVTIKPFSTNIHQEVLDAAMFVSTSDFEGLSNSMLEAMAIGLPCICTDCDGGGARDVIENGVNGLLVPKGDKDAVVNAMETLIMNPDYAEMLGKNASKIKDELSEERIIEEWKKLL